MPSSLSVPGTEGDSLQLGRQTPTQKHTHAVITECATHRKRGKVRRDSFPETSNGQGSDEVTCMIPNTTALFYKRLYSTS